MMTPQDHFTLNAKMIEKRLQDAEHQRLAHLAESTNERALTGLLRSISKRVGRVLVHAGDIFLNWSGDDTRITQKTRYNAGNLTAQ